LIDDPNPRAYSRALAMRGRLAPPDNDRKRGNKVLPGNSSPGKFYHMMATVRLPVGRNLHVAVVQTGNIDAALIRSCPKEQAPCPAGPAEELSGAVFRGTRKITPSGLRRYRLNPGAAELSLGPGVSTGAMPGTNAGVTSRSYFSAWPPAVLQVSP
jgi:hypothetical protein